MKSSSHETLERIARRIPIPEPAYERVLHRWDRRRRNQRIAAGAVGMAVFVAAVLIAGAVGLSDRSQGPAGGRETGPAETGPSVTGPLTGYTGDPFSVGFDGLPPKGATPSEPIRGELVMKEGGFPYAVPFVHVYADGRLIWSKVIPGQGPAASAWIEQRLTPEGVELLRSGAVPLVDRGNPGQQLPVGAWEDLELRPYVASRWAICPWFTYDERDPAPALHLLPAAARDLLSGMETKVFGEWGCFVVTLDDARVLAEILNDAGFEGLGSDAPEAGPGGLAWAEGGEVFQFQPVLPDGTIVSEVGS